MGHGFRRTSASMLFGAGADILQLKRFGGWKSNTYAEGFIADSFRGKQEAASFIRYAISTVPHRSTRFTTKYFLVTRDAIQPKESSVYTSILSETPVDLDVIDSHANTSNVYPKTMICVGTTLYKLKVTSDHLGLFIPFKTTLLLGTYTYYLCVKKIVGNKQRYHSISENHADQFNAEERMSATSITSSTYEFNHSRNSRSTVKKNAFKFIAIPKIADYDIELFSFYHKPMNYAHHRHLIDKCFYRKENLFVISLFQKLPMILILSVRSKIY